MAPADRREPLQRQLRLLDARVHESFDQDEDEAAMSYPDAQGIGSGPDLVQLMTAEAFDEGQPENTVELDRGDSRVQVARN